MTWAWSPLGAPPERGTELPVFDRPRPSPGECSDEVTTWSRSCQRGTGSHAERSERFQTAVDVLVAAVRDFPDDDATIRQLALASNNLGSFCRAEGDSFAGESALGRSRELLGRLLAKQPTSTAYKTDLARTLLNLGEIRLRSGALRESENPLEEGLVVIDADRTGQSVMCSPIYILGSQIIDALGVLRAQQGRTTIAKRMFQDKIAEIEVLRNRSSDASVFKIDLAEAWTGVASIESQLGRIEAATEACDTARAILDGFDAEKLDLNEQRVFFESQTISTQLPARPDEKLVDRIGLLHRADPEP